MSKLTMRQIFLFHEKDPSIKEKLHDIDKEQCIWVYFGQNISQCREIETTDLSGIARHNIASELQESAKKIRQKYINYVGSLLPEKDQFFWWLTSVSEKNFHVSHLFLYLCYLDIGVTYSQKTTRNVIIVAESLALLSALEQNIANNNTINVVFFRDHFRQKIYLMKQNTGFFLRRIFFLIRWICRYFLSRLFGLYRWKKRDRAHKDAITVLHSWLDQRSLSKGNEYQELYLGSLGTELQHNKQNIVYLIDVLPTVFFPFALLNMLNKKDDLYIMEEFLPLGEVFKAFFKTYTRYPIPEIIPPFESYEIDPIVRDELYTDRKNTRAAQAYFCYVVGKQLSKKFRMKMFVYSFENLMWEKMFCYALNESIPTTRKIAYQHVLPCPMYTFYSISEKEKPVCPLPNLILTNGLKGKTSLIESGFDAVKIIVTGPLRFKRLAKNLTKKTKGTDIVVLIPTSASINESVELLSKSIAAFQNDKTVKVFIKFHPTLPASSVLNNLPDLPSTFTITDDSSEKILDQTDVVVYTSSSVAAEAVARGIPVVHIKSDYWIDTNILEGSDLVPSVSTPDELNTHMNKANKRGFLKPIESDSIINDLFGNIDYSEFLQYITEIKIHGINEE